MTTRLIETVRVRNGAAPLWGLHLRRLVASCRALGVPFPTELAVPEGGDDRVHRIEVGPRGMTVTERAVGSTEPVRLVLGASPHRPYPHKTTDRAQFEAAQAEARAAGMDDALLVAPGGWAAETAIWGVFWWESDRLAAPALELGILPGVARMRLDELVGVDERRVEPERLAERGVFVANAVRGVIRVAELAGRPVAPHRRTEELAGRFWG